MRVEYPGAVYHVLARGNNRDEIFVTDAMKCRFLDTLEEACEQTGWRIHAYVLMPNHYHLLLETPEANLVAGMKWLQGTYTQRFNRALGRVGHLFQGRYKSLIIDPDAEEYFRRVSTYIHLNPFRSGGWGVGFDRSLESYSWSSYPRYLKPAGLRPSWLEVGRVLESVGIRGGERRDRERYRQWLEKRMAWEVDPLHAEQVRSAHASLTRGWCLGDKTYRTWLLGQVTSGGDNLRGEQRREHGEQAANALLAAGLARQKLTESDLLDRKSTDPEKQALAWLMKTRTTVTCTWIAERLRMGHRTNASRAVNRVERATDRSTQNLKKGMLQCTG